MQVAIDTAVFSEDQVPLEVFDAALTEVALLMERGPLPRFLGQQTKSGM